MLFGKSRLTPAVTLTTAGTAYLVYKALGDRGAGLLASLHLGAAAAADMVIAVYADDPTSVAGDPVCLVQIVAADFVANPGATDTSAFVAVKECGQVAAGFPGPETSVKSFGDVWVVCTVSGVACRLGLLMDG